MKLTLALSAPIPGGTATPVPVVVDAFDSGPVPGGSPR
jgi:hypothetical protein